MAQPIKPIAPTASLPPLKRLANCPLIEVIRALANLRTLYSPGQLTGGLQLKAILNSYPHLIHDDSVPDSGYASAEEDSEDDELSCSDSEDNEALELLRADELERGYAIKWLTGFAARSDVWMSSIPEPEVEAYTSAIDEAASLLALFTGSGVPEEAITRKFSLPGPDGRPVEVELNDAPLLSEDHTSVGLQSWASSILLAERMCAGPAAFCLGRTTRKEGLRVLELGAGTGMLSIAAAHILARTQISMSPLVVATDFHPDVLANLRRNVNSNKDAQGILVRELDWSQPNLQDAPFDRPFDVILAADVVYEPLHASWIASCVTKLLAHPGGVMWMIIALRPSGRHEGLASTVGEAFSHGEGNKRLAVLEEETLQKEDGRGRADEAGYKLFKIGWVQG
ncbi:putative methyltransferase-domain-containing protein [Gloeopeniophorella convolvens]|nr:putative methyltransferase-domain-containing protein [Gloeopeniophorella convolvens]